MSNFILVYQDRSVRIVDSFQLRRLSRQPTGDRFIEIDFSLLNPQSYVTTRSIKELLNDVYKSATYNIKRLHKVVVPQWIKELTNE